MDENITCPYCEKTSCYIFYLNANTIICNECDKEFEIDIFVASIAIKGSKL